MSIRKNLRSQFGRPRGMLGHVAGWVMAYAGPNAERTRLTVAKLELGPASRVLEVGFGPGLAIERAAALTPDGLVAGLEASEVMLAQARRRNRDAIAQGRVDLRNGTVSAIPDFGDPFDVVFAVNTLHHWPDVPTGLSEILRVLAPGGTLVVTEQPRSPRATSQVAEQRAEAITELMRDAGFKGVTWETIPLAPVDAALVRGAK